MKQKSISEESVTDWERVEAMTDAEIDLSDIPAIAPEKFAQAIVRRGLQPSPKKQQLTLRLDSDVVAWFKAQGQGYQSRMNALLRAYMDAHTAESKQSAQR